MTPEDSQPNRETLADYAPFHQSKDKDTPTTDDVRQGVTGHGVRYVLAVSLGLSLVALFLAWSYLT